MAGDERTLAVPVSVLLVIAKSCRDALDTCGHLTDDVLALINLSRARAEPWRAGALAIELETASKIIVEELKHGERLVTLLRQSSP